MSYYDVIYEYAADNYGLITTDAARELGIPGIELVKLSHRGRLEHIWHGVYRIEHYIPAPLDKYAEAVAIVGEGAYIYGESVLAMHNLAYVNPPVIYIAYPKQLRKKLPPHIKAVRDKAKTYTLYEGIPIQKLNEAILVCRKSVMRERLEDAAGDAVIYGFLTEPEALLVKEELYTYER